METNRDFSQGKLGGMLFKMAVPSIIAMVVNGLYYLVDTAFVGWGVGSSALTGLAVVFPVQMFMIAWGSMLGMGAAALIARSLGEGKTSQAKLAAQNAVVLALLSGIAFLLCTLTVQEPLLYGLGATEGSFSDARNYLSALQWGFVWVFLSMVGFNIARAKGAAKQAGMGMLLGTVLNMLLDPLFIFVFKMGVGGAAWATVLARVVSTGYFIFILKKDEMKWISGAVVKNFQSRIAVSIISLGLGNFLGQVSISVVAVITNVTLSRYGGGTDLAVYGILSRLLVFISMPLLGLSQGLQPIAAYNYGAGRLDRVRSVSVLALLTAVGIGAAMYMLPLFAPAFTLHLFSDDPSVIAAGIFPLRLALAAVPVVGIQILGFTLFQSLGQPLKTLLVSLSRQLIFLVPLLLVLPQFFGKTGLWIAYPLADTLSVVFTLFMTVPVFRHSAMKPSDGQAAIRA